MITLNGERGYENPKSWEDISSLPGFTETLDPKENELKEIIGRYFFKERVSCGLSGCRRPHERGYVVTTKNGQVTNIGNICGKNHFGVEFKDLSKAYDRAITEHGNREAIASFLFRVEDLEEEIKELRKGLTGVDNVYKTSQALINKGRGCPEVLVTEVGKLIRGRDSSIVVSREATEKEAKAQEVMENKSLPRPIYIQEKKGTLRGLEFLYPENDLRELLIKDIERHINEIKALDLVSASYKELQYWSKWCGELESKMETVEELLESGKKLLVKSNVSQLACLLSDSKDIFEFNSWLSKSAFE